PASLRTLINHKGHEGTPRNQVQVTATNRPGMTADEVSHAVITAAMKVHSALGPGLLESAYEACLQHELRKMGLKSEAQVELPVVYDSIKLDLGYRIDLLVEDLVIVELKSVEALTAVHQAQILSYLKLSGKSLGCSLTSTSLT
ncbi:MAG TPA: GxxExxY protein, partial [Terriglobales bacterium]|nr:GxxExxY protein [Terriglobales bacterium]